MRRTKVNSRTVWGKQIRFMWSDSLGARNWEWLLRGVKDFGYFEASVLINYGKFGLRKMKNRHFQFV